MAEMFRREKQCSERHFNNRNVIMNLTTFAILLLIFCFTPVGCNITIRPESTIASVGSETRLDCGTDLEYPMMWVFTPYNSSQPKTISFGKHIVSEFVGKYQMNTSIEGRFDLIILLVCMDDAGTYSCFDNEGEDEVSAVADLTVVGRRKKCEGDSPEVELLICGSHPGNNITVDYFNNSVFDPRNPGDESPIRHFRNDSDESEYCRYIQVRVTGKHGIVNCSDRIFEERRSGVHVELIGRIIVGGLIICFIILVIAAVYIKVVLRRKKKSTPGQPTDEGATTATDDEAGNEESTSKTQLYPPV